MKKIKINNTTILEVESGQNLLDSLRGNDILIPTSCGGIGTCLKCKVKINNDIPYEILEEVMLSEEDKKLGMRLSCQLCVDDDMHVIVPEGIASAALISGVVEDIKYLTSGIKEITIIPQSDFPILEGGYIQVKIPENFILQRTDNSEIFMRLPKPLYNFERKERELRAYSFANSRYDSNKIILNVRFEFPKKSDQFPGLGSSYIFSLERGDEVEIIGPYNDFDLNESDNEKIFIGGGVGLSPLKSHIDYLNKSNFKGEYSLWYGARTEKDIYYKEYFDELNIKNKKFEYFTALSNLEKDTKYAQGYIHEHVEKYLKETGIDCKEFYLCGPPPMLNAAIEMLKSHGVADKNISFDKF